MSIHAFLELINKFLALPSTVIFVTAGIILTINLRFLQVRTLSSVWHTLRRLSGNQTQESQRTLNPFRALFTAMATTIGMGSVVGPSIALMIGGPGALFWLLIYPFFGGLIKFVETTFALTTRVVMPTGRVVGGPAEYLKLISPVLGAWYGVVTIFLFTTWIALQANTLGQIYLLESVPPYATGLVLALILAGVVFGGVKRIGHVASILVPIMFIAYVTFALFVIIKNSALLPTIIKQVLQSALNPHATMAGIAGSSLFAPMRNGIYRSIFITEAGLGTSSIPHALSQVERPTDQGLLAMYSTVFDALLALLSGLLVLVTGVWQRGNLDSTVIYQVFQVQSPLFGRPILLGAISLFVLTTIIGNTLNGSQGFAALTQGRFIKGYLILAIICVFLGSISNVPLLWEFSDIMLSLVAVPNIIALVMLSFKYPHVLQISKSEDKPS